LVVGVVGQIGLIVDWYVLWLTNERIESAKGMNQRVPEAVLRMKQPYG
jgi:hypothetical protein